MKCIHNVKNWGGGEGGGEIYKEKMKKGDILLQIAHNIHRIFLVLFRKLITLLHSSIMCSCNLTISWLIYYFYLFTSVSLFFVFLKQTRQRANDNTAVDGRLSWPQATSRQHQLTMSNLFISVHPLNLHHYCCRETSNQLAV